MAVHNEIGSWGEKVAADMLTAEGYTILHLNWRPEHGRQEVDVIAQTEEQIVFVEVKTRTSCAFGAPEEYVSPEKTKNLCSAAKAFFSQYGCYQSFTVRFDVVAVVLGPCQHKLVSYRHMTNAFQSVPCFY